MRKRIAQAVINYYGDGYDYEITGEHAPGKLQVIIRDSETNQIEAVWNQREPQSNKFDIIDEFNSGEVSI